MDLSKKIINRVGMEVVTKFGGSGADFGTAMADMSPKRRSAGTASTSVSAFCPPQSGPQSTGIQAAQATGIQAAQATGIQSAQATGVQAAQTTGGQSAGDQSEGGSMGEGAPKYFLVLTWH